MTSDPPKSSVLSLNTVIVASLDKDHNDYPEVHRQVEDVQLVVLDVANDNGKLSSQPGLRHGSFLHRNIESRFRSSVFPSSSSLLGTWVSLGGATVGLNDGTSSTSGGILTRSARGGKI